MTMRVTIRPWWPSIFRAGAWLGVPAFCLLAGCWQEVEYSEAPATADSPANESPNSAAPESAEPIAGTDAAADQFANDLASTLAEEPSAIENDATSDVTAPESSPLVDVTDSDDTAGGDDLFGDFPTEETTAEPETSAAAEPDSLFPPDQPSDAESPESETAARPYDPLFDDPIVPTEPETDSLTPGEAPVAPAEEAMPSLPEKATLPTDAAGESAGASSANKVHRAAWLLGSKLSLGALAHGKGAPGEDVQALMNQARTLAKLFGMTVPDLPARAIGSAADEVPEKSLDYLFAEGNQIGAELARRQGIESSALFEIAVKSNILLVLYRPGSPAVEAISTAITQAGERAQLPAALWQPLVDLLARQAPVDEVRAGVYRLHADVDRYFEAE